ncbi:DUF2254 domain-containing protein [Arthrobacter sp. Leaf234]|uniref:DUF2254 domain-containing protein n=1 Tax=Arthrobacter sp. Leaf234 TaxID=1736303 RepID=UPI000B2D415A|nr:DUF2254 domain-containing protein [Arthrobacter sp. Leaf234]
MAAFDSAVMRDSLRSQLWPVPLAAVLAAILLGQFLPVVDRRLDDDLPAWLTGVLFSGGPEAARSLLETIASSMVTVTSLTFSLTVVTLQLASSQFSPRLLRTFTRDRFVHNTLALFLATFVFALTVLRSIRVETSSGPAFVPELAVTAAFVLTITSVIGLVLFLAHLSRQIRVETMLRDVHHEADQTLDKVFPPDQPSREETCVPPAPAAVITTRSSGFLIRVDPDKAVAAATRAEAFVSIDVAPGTSVISGIPVARAWSLTDAILEGDRLSDLEKHLDSALHTGFERTSTQDAGFGLQQLLDVANKALSPGVNDPTTAVHAISHISAVLCTLVSRPTGPRTLHDSDGSARLTLTYPTFTQLLELAVDQLLTYAFTDPRAARRTLAMLHEIAMTAHTAPESSAARGPVQSHIRRMRSAIDASPLDSDIRARLHNELLHLENEL